MKARDVVVVDGVRTAFGRAGEKGYFWLTRADDLVVKVIRELLRRNPKVRPDMVEENVWGATTQEGDQGLTLGRTSVILSGLPESCAGFSVDRMCAGGLTAITTAASEIAASGNTASGNASTNFVPLPTWLSTSISPPCSRTMP